MNLQVTIKEVNLFGLRFLKITYFGLSRCSIFSDINRSLPPDTVDIFNEKKNIFKTFYVFSHDPT